MLQIVCAVVTLGFARAVHPLANPLANPYHVPRDEHGKDLIEESVDSYLSGHRSANLPPQYHTTKDLHDRMVALSQSCEAVELRKVQDNNSELEYLHFKPYWGASQEKPKLMIFANEHAREMITAEAAMAFAEDMCKKDGTAAEARKLVEALIVVNANPVARSVVENGDFCKRTNPNGVDINRNWDDKFAMGSTLDQTSPGPRAFSEVESRMLKQIAESFQPEAYFSLHSGFKGILLANKFGEPEHKSDLDKANSIFAELNKKFCNCPEGPADLTLNYHAAGTSLDYVADKIAVNKLSVAFEMWPDKSYNAFSQADDKLSAWSFLQRSESRGKLAHEMSEPEIQRQGPDWCLRAFNPVGQKNFDDTMTKFKTMFADVAFNLGNDRNSWHGLMQKF